MHKVRNSSRSLTMLLTATALAMALSGTGVEGPFAGISQDNTLDLRIDINRADRKEVESLPGIGPVLAGRILQHRTDHGPFRNCADLKAVKGIGGALAGSLDAYIETKVKNESVGAFDDEVGGGKKGRVYGRR